MDWEYFFEQHVEPGIERVAMGFAIVYKGHVYITRRRRGDYLEECFEFPTGLAKMGQEGVFEACRRILKEEYRLDLVSIDYYLNAFTFTSPNKNKTRQFNFAVTVKNPKSLRFGRNDHGLWMKKEEMGHWPIMTVLRTALINLWAGEGYDPLIADYLIETAKKENVWRHKVRLIPLQERMMLLLKRSRRQKVFPLLYEFPGKEIPSGIDIDTILVEAMQEQTGFPPEAIVGYVGHYDYVSGQDFEKVREFYYLVVAPKGQNVRLSTHAYAFWTEDFDVKKVEVTPSVHEGIAALSRRFILGPTPKVKMPPPAYCDPNESAKSRKQRKGMDAWTEMQNKGVFDLAALEGQVLVKRGLPEEIRKQLSY